MWDEGSNCLVRSQPSLLKLTKRRKRRKSDGLKKTEDLSRMRMWLVGMWSTGGRNRQTTFRSRASNLAVRHTRLLLPWQHLREGSHLCLKVSCCFFTEVTSVERGRVWNVRWGSSCLYQRSSLAVEESWALFPQTTWWQSRMKVRADDSRTKASCERKAW